MLPSTQRLNCSAFDRAFSNSRILRHPLCQLRLHRLAGGVAITQAAGAQQTGDASQNSRLPTRAAFVVAKKLGQATVRNRTRRRLRERYRLSALRHDARLAGCDLIWMAAAPALEATTDELDAAVAQLLGRAVRAMEDRTAL